MIKDPKPGSSYMNNINFICERSENQDEGKEKVCKKIDSIQFQKAVTYPGNNVTYIAS